MKCEFTCTQHTNLQLCGDWWWTNAIPALIVIDGHSNVSDGDVTGNYVDIDSWAP